MPFLSPCALRVFCVFLYRLRLIDPSLALRQQAWREALMAGPHREPPPGERQEFGHDSRTIMNRKQRRRREKEDKAAEKPAASLLQRVAGFFDQGRLSEALKLCRQAVKKHGNFSAQSNLGNVLARLGRTGLSAPTQGRFYSLTLANAQIQACGSNLPLLGAGTLRLWCIRENCGCGLCDSFLLKTVRS